MGLFGPAWNSKNEAKAIAAVQKIMDEDELLRVALNRGGEPALEALRRIGSPELLRKAAQEAPDPEVRLAGAQRIENTDVLRELEKRERDQTVRSYLSDRLRKEDLARADRLMQGGNLFAAAKAFWDIPWGDEAKKKFEECIGRITLEAKAEIDSGRYREAQARLAEVDQAFRLGITPVHPQWKGERIRFDESFFSYCYGLACICLRDLKGYDRHGSCVGQKKEHIVGLIRKACETGMQLMEEGDYRNALAWFEYVERRMSLGNYEDVLPAEDIKRRRDECWEKWHADPANPDYCPASEDHWHSYEVIDSDYPHNRTVGWEKKRCRHCGKTVTVEVPLYW